MKNIINTQNQVICDMSYEIDNLVDELFLHHDISMVTTKSLDDMDDTIIIIKLALEVLVKARNRSELEELVRDIIEMLDDMTETTNAIKEDLEKF